MAPLKVDEPPVVIKQPDGVLVSRHFEDGSTRTILYKPNGDAQITTVRTNPSTGAQETLIENSFDGTSRLEIHNPDGSQTFIDTGADGRTEETRLFTDETGVPTRLTKFADGSFENERTLVDEGGTTRHVLTRSDGTQEVTQFAHGTDDNGNQFFSEVKLAGDGTFMFRKDTTTFPDGSSKAVTRDGPGASHVVETVTTQASADGAVRIHIQRADGTDETMLRREFDANGQHFVEVQHDDRVEIDATSPGHHSRTTKFEDGTEESFDTSTGPDGTLFHTTISRGGSIEKTEQPPGDPARVVTTRSDGTRFEQTFDDGRMTTTTFHPKGESTVRRQDMDGFGSVQDFDAQGNQTGPLIVLKGEPLEARGDLTTDEDVPVGDVAVPGDASGGESAPAEAAEPDLVSDIADIDAAVAQLDADADSESSPTDGPAAPGEPFEPAADPVLGGPNTVPDENAPVLELDEPDDFAPVIEIDEDNNIEVHDFVERPGTSFTVTETPGGDIGPDPDVPVEPFINPVLEEFPTEQPGTSFTVTETDGVEITPDPDVPTDDSFLESF